MIDEKYDYFKDPNYLLEYKLNQMISKAALDYVRTWFMETFDSVKDSEVLANHYTFLINKLEFNLKRDYNDVPYLSTDNIRKLFKDYDLYYQICK